MFWRKKRRFEFDEDDLERLKIHVVFELEDKLSTKLTSELKEYIDHRIELRIKAAVHREVESMAEWDAMYTKSEEFIDDVVARINRKQV